MTDVSQITDTLSRNPDAGSLVMVGVVIGLALSGLFALVVALRRAA